MKPSRILIIFTAFLLLLSLSASVLAAQPKQGVYVKQDSAGKISALMYVISKQGKGPLASAAPTMWKARQPWPVRAWKGSALPVKTCAIHRLRRRIIPVFLRSISARSGGGMWNMIFPIRTVWSPEAAAQNWTALMYMMEAWNVMLLFRP